MKKRYFQVYDKSGMVYYTDENDRILTPAFSIYRLYDFVRPTYIEIHLAQYLDDHWDSVCLRYWNEVITKLPSSEYKSFNTPQQTKEKV